MVSSILTIINNLKKTTIMQILKELLWLILLLTTGTIAFLLLIGEAETLWIQLLNLLVSAVLFFATYLLYRAGEDSNLFQKIKKWFHR